MKNRQTYVIMVQSKQGSAWPVATPTKRGFTKVGADTALDTIRQTIPADWKCWVEEMTSIDFLLDAVSVLRR